MKAHIKERVLTDGSKVFNVEVADGDHTLVFDCCSEADAIGFMFGIQRLCREHTVEILEEV